MGSGDGLGNGGERAMKLPIPEEATINGLDVVGAPIPFAEESCSGLDDPVFGTT